MWSKEVIECKGGRISVKMVRGGRLPKTLPSTGGGGVARLRGHVKFSYIINIEHCIVQGRVYTEWPPCLVKDELTSYRGTV
jgi:hypothetical protein